ncbi:DUF2336 domain-containing protein [Sphingomonas sp. dw_22]|uniref:DUF2336 domain-containing protein n=1 Tax=Sphingomonas sp. dw_22 TaxID=2721175 RepID=UPI001BD404E8|nr:DUF2336 domain-containing protein [Sphingomonas sp. dw_22]
MSDHPVDMRDGHAIGATELLARAAAAELCVQRGLQVTIDDFFLPEGARLDEHSRSALAELLRALVATVESQIRRHGGDLTPEPVFARLMRSGLLHDPELMAELIGRVRQDLLGQELPAHAPDDPERPSLINRFVEHPDRVVAASAMALLIAESRRRASPETGHFIQTDLPAELHHRLVWWVAAALREGSDDPTAALDHALSEAATRALAAYDEGDRLETSAMRFAVAVNPQRGELSDLLVEALGDRRIVLFIALLGHALGVDYGLAREMVLDASGDRLWLALRALEMPRAAVAQVGYALCEADPRRDLESFAELLDAIAAIEPIQARAALTPLRLHPDYRAALLALRRGGAR